MNKKGQFYIITVLIASFVIYGLVSGANTIKEPTLLSGFDRLSRNYVDESPRVVNYQIFLENSDPGNIDSFTSEYIKYAKSKNPTIGLFYAYRKVDYTNDKSVIGIKNYYDESIVVERKETIFGAEEDSLQDVSIDVGGKDFFFQFPVKIKNFGDEYYGRTILGDKVEIDIGGIIHTINYPPSGSGGPSFYAVVKSKEGELVDIQRTGSDEFII